MENKEYISVVDPVELHHVEQRSTLCVLKADDATHDCMQSVGGLQTILNEVLELLTGDTWNAIANGNTSVSTNHEGGLNNTGTTGTGVVPPAATTETDVVIRRNDSSSPVGALGELLGNVSAAGTSCLPNSNSDGALLTTLMTVRGLVTEKLPSAACQLREANRVLVDIGQTIDKSVTEAKKIRSKRLNSLNRLSCRSHWFKRRSLIVESLDYPSFDKVRSEMPSENEFRTQCGDEPWWVDYEADAHQYTLNRLWFEKRERELSLRCLEESKGLRTAAEAELDSAQKNVKKLVGALVSFEANLPPLLKDVQRLPEDVLPKILPSCALGLPRKLLDIFLNIFNHLSIANDQPDLICDVEGVPLSHTAVANTNANNTPSSPMPIIPDSPSTLGDTSNFTPFPQCVAMSFNAPNETDFITHSHTNSTSTAEPILMPTSVTVRFYYFPTLDIVTATCTADMIFNFFAGFSRKQDSCLSKLFASVPESPFVDDTGTPPTDKVQESRTGPNTTTVQFAIASRGYGRPYRWLTALAESDFAVGTGTQSTAAHGSAAAGRRGVGSTNTPALAGSSSSGASSTAATTGGASSSAATCGGVSSTAATTGGASSTAATSGGASSTSATSGGASSTAATTGGASSTAATSGGASSTSATSGGASSTAATT
eukprot:Lankesteria_metandrocarpae@DN9222_c0_g1_i1.p1